ncbi:MAG TPA: DUF4209 domain-containing protein, partial [Polyangiaceae bacterium]|nr:DUF4209 domain-containing protein [Polyangiaceae bacterium]
SIVGLVESARTHMLGRVTSETLELLDGLRQSEWQTIAADNAAGGYSSLTHALYEASKVATAGGKIAQGDALGILARACSMILSPDSTNEPFKPGALIGGKRTAIPDDLADGDVKLLAAAAGESADPWLIARFADLVWLLSRPRNAKYALLAIDAYRRLPMDAQMWVRGTRETWQRAIDLCRTLRRGAGTRLDEIEAVLLSEFVLSTTEGGFRRLHLAELLEKARLGRSNASSIAQGLERAARDFERRGDAIGTHEFALAASRWFETSRDDAKKTDMMVLIAECFEQQAVASGSHLSANSLYGKALQTYRSIPRSERRTRGLDARMSALYGKLKDAGLNVLDEMSEFTSPSIDITEHAAQARDAVTGKSAIEALTNFADIARGASVSSIRASSEELLRQYPLESMLSTTHFARDGRVVAKHEGGCPDSSSDNVDSVDSVDSVLWAKMVEQYKLRIEIVVKASIWPALEVLSFEHRLRESDFMAISRHSPVIPPGRELLFGKGIFEGYDHDFVGALHILIPQMEHMVRWHLQQANVRTKNVDQAGVENEIGLSALLDLPEAKAVFPEDLLFEFKALFSDRFGPNLRNELAHGLLDDRACKSSYGVYAWWLALRITLKSCLAQQRDTDVGEGSRSSSEEHTSG